VLFDFLSRCGVKIDFYSHVRIANAHDVFELCTHITFKLAGESSRALAGTIREFVASGSITCVRAVQRHPIGAHH
jgi:hypothetical protein